MPKMMALRNHSHRGSLHNRGIQMLGRKDEHKYNKSLLMMKQSHLSLYHLLFFHGMWKCYQPARSPLSCSEATKCNAQPTYSLKNVDSITNIQIKDRG